MPAFRGCFRYPLKTDDNQIILAEEKGYNTYTKVDDSKCQLAQDWWAKHHSYWADVRTEWQSIFEKKKDISMLSSIEEKPLFMHMFDLQDKSNDSKAIEKQIKAFLK